MSRSEGRERVFAKTGTRRQADLVKLVADHMSPLAQPASRPDQR
jgi:hypothetical protein